MDLQLNYIIELSRLKMHEYEQDAARERGLREISQSPRSVASYLARGVYAFGGALVEAGQKLQAQLECQRSTQVCSPIPTNLRSL